MVPKLLLPPWADGEGGRKKERKGLTPVAGATADRDRIQRDVQGSRAAPHSFKYQLWEGGGITHPLSPFASGSQLPA